VGRTPNRVGPPTHAKGPGVWSRVALTLANRAKRTRTVMQISGPSDGSFARRATETRSL
jgi:hypothetical protein